MIPKTFDKSQDVKFVPKSMYYDMLDSENLANVNKAGPDQFQFDTFQMTDEEH